MVLSVIFSATVSSWYLRCLSRCENWVKGLIRASYSWPYRASAFREPCRVVVVVVDVALVSQDRVSR